MKQMGEGGFFLILWDKSKYEIETFAGGTSMRYKLTLIVFVLTPLTLEDSSIKGVKTKIINVNL